MGPWANRPVSLSPSPPLSSSWWGKDSNLRRPEPTDLQSVPVGRFGTPPETSRGRRRTTCPRQDSNLYAISGTGPSNQPVCQFQHVGRTPLRLRAREDSNLKPLDP